MDVRVVHTFGRGQLTASERGAPFAHANLAPMEPYEGKTVPVLCLCLCCGEEVEVTWSRLNAGSWCPACGSMAVRPARTSQLLAGWEAEEPFEAAGLLPLVPYEGSMVPRLCHCWGCGREVLPSRATLVAGYGGCPACADRGFQPSKPAVLYLLGHAELGAVKVGITGVGSTRLANHQRHGWAVVELLSFSTGHMAHEAEQVILAQLKAEGAVPHLTAEQMPVGGWTETVAASLWAGRTLTGVLVQGFAR